MMKLLLYVVIGLAGLIVYVRFIEATTVFLPAKSLLATPKDAGLDFEDIHFSTVDEVKLHGWLVPAGSLSRHATLIFLHGNAGNIGDRVEKVAFFQRLGLNVFIIDYRGYGKSAGKPTEAGMYRDALAAFDYLKTRNDIDPQRILVYGASLGGAAATDLALHRPIAGLILDSAFTSAADMGRVILPFVPSMLLSIKLDSLSKIPKITVPKLFIHSPDDETVPYALGKKLYDAASGPKTFLKITGSHNEGFFDSQNVFRSGLGNFLKTNRFVAP